ncbi:hypothetical protein CFOL_v3_11349, partial [Cephalotus follicularis]
PFGSQNNCNNQQGACFTCGQVGHRMKDSPKRQDDIRATLANEETIENGDDFLLEPKFDDEQREEIEPEDYDCLVIHRVLAIPKEDEEDWLHNIFKTRCKSHGKICSLLINEGSCKNIVAQEMVNKLNLKVELHPKPYRMAWFKKDNEVKVTKRCLISFSMEKNYGDQIWCDIVPMDVTHILLGRPWKYERGALHGDRKNTYTFKMGNMEIVLIPIKQEKGHIS